ncbi:MAG: PepSY-like domain-containing protein [Cyclobacteriaceae bacterium]
MKTIRVIFAMMLVSAVMISCQEQDDAMTNELDLASEAVVTDISPEDLPGTAVAYIEDEYAGELVVEAYKITEATGEVFFESFLTNNFNITFEESGEVLGVSEEESRVTCDGRKKDRKGGKGRKHRGDSTSRPDKPVEITIDELPEASAAYLADNYADSTIRKILKVTLEDESNLYLALVAQVGAVVFDSEGNFVEIRNRSKACFNFEQVAIEDLSEAITSYIAENYPDAVVLRARQGTIKEVPQIHVLLESIGVLIFDAEGNFLKLKECKPKA